MAIGILFPQDDEQPLSAQDFTGLAAYQAAVGGTIESIDSGAEGTAFFAHDEAKLIGLTINRRATLFWWLHLPAARYHDILSGPVILVGPTGPDGETQNVPASLHHLLLSPSNHYRVEYTAEELEGWHVTDALKDGYFAAVELALDLTDSWPYARELRIVQPK